MASYVVKSGDTLSQIVKKNYPFGNMYGSQGRIAQVLAKNPHIKNPVQVAQNKNVPLVPEIPQVQTPEAVK